MTKFKENILDWRDKQLIKMMIRLNKMINKREKKKQDYQSRINDENFIKIIKNLNDCNIIVEEKLMSEELKASPKRNLQMGIKQL